MSCLRAGTSGVIALCCVIMWSGCQDSQSWELCADTHCAIVGSALEGSSLTTAPRCQPLTSRNVKQRYLIRTTKAATPPLIFSVLDNRACTSPTPTLMEVVQDRHSCAAISIMKRRNRVEGRSSWAQEGLCVHGTEGFWLQLWNRRRR